MKFLRRTAHILSILLLPYVALLVSCALASQSKEKAQQPTATPGSNSNPSPRGSESVPAFVRILQSDKEANAEQDRQQKVSDTNWTRTLAVLTLLLGAGQLVVYIVQARRLRDTIDKMDEIAKAQGKDMSQSIAEAKRTANAAIDSATTARNTMVLQLRARLGLESIEAIDWGQDSPPILRLVFKNFGGKGAHVTRYCGVPTITGLPAAPNYEPHWDVVGVPTEANDIFEAFVELPVLTKQLWEDIHAEPPKATIHVWGAVEYNSGFNQTKTVGFGRRYDPKFSRRLNQTFFAIAGGAAYNRHD